MVHYNQSLTLCTKNSFFIQLYTGTIKMKLEKKLKNELTRLHIAIPENPD